jgi:hypothetical protein
MQDTTREGGSVGLTHSLRPLRGGCESDAWWTEMSFFSRLFDARNGGPSPESDAAAGPSTNERGGKPADATGPPGGRKKGAPAPVAAAPPPSPPAAPPRPPPLSKTPVVPTVSTQGAPAKVKHVDPVQGRDASSPAPMKGRPAVAAPTKSAVALPVPLPRSVRARSEPDPKEVLTEATVGTRPPAPQPFVKKEPVESIAQTFDRLLGAELDSTFAQLKLESGRPPAPGTDTAPVEEVRTLFEDLAVNYMRPVRDFLIDLKWSDASRDWLDVCAPAVGSLRQSAEKMDFAELVAALESFARELAAARAASEAVIDGAARDAIFAAHERLVAVMPRAFTLDLDRVERESIIVHALLLRVPDVRKPTLDRLYAAGVNDIASLASARPDELARVTGIPVPVAERIVERFRAYRAEIHAATPDAGRTQERARIGTLLGELADQHARFERASSGWSPAATEAKKLLRRAREETLLEIRVLLARLGEVERLREIDRLPFERKLEVLHVFLKGQTG